MKFLLAPNSFKGTMRSVEVSHIMKNAILSVDPKATILEAPMADGGEGTINTLGRVFEGRFRHTIVRGPLGKPVRAKYGVIKDHIGLIEMAEAAGLSLAKPDLDPMNASTYGVGELIKALLNEEKIDELFIGLGGSATTDGGCGMASALGVSFKDQEGKEFLPVGGNLEYLKAFDDHKVRELLRGVKVTGLCDVDAPLFGEEGAAHVYGPQKGASPLGIHVLENGLKNLNRVIIEETGVDYSSFKGAGAAGGMGEGILAFLGGQLKPGAECILDALGFDELLEGVDYVFTGEGKIDSQTLQGKGVCCVLKRAFQKGVRTIAVVGDLGNGYEPLYKKGLTACFSINRIAQDRQLMKQRAPIDLFSTVQDIVRLIEGKNQKY